jgi:SAM-dependent methyltransferase
MSFNHFDIISGIYNRWGRFKLDHPLIEMLDLKEDDILLDIGGGTGRVANALAGRSRQVVVIDTSAGMLSKAPNKAGISPLMADSAILPVPGGSVDRVLIVDALHHIKKQQETIEELCRSLKPDGVAVIVEPDVGSVFVKLIILVEFLFMMGSHFLNRDELVKMFDHQSGKTSACIWRGNVIVQYRKQPATEKKGLAKARPGVVRTNPV